ncbi:arylesterase [Methylocystis echinoides]|uniref:Arylesterase n=1 Tax=Methylocystis echinoides TaxID=29468 RepID=A0A9W6GV68_9HYPH|nr:arylesterase [Methylocystis echinoides]GLI93484.1 arylesterase [Methylocystis echinoides]
MIAAPCQTLPFSPLSRRFGRWLQILAFATPLLWSAGAEAAPKRVLAFGDSLTAGFGLPAADALPVQLEKRLRDGGFDVKVVNAGVSGDTTEMGLARLDYALSDGPFDVALLELGANDMLRGLSPKDARANLEKIIEAFRSKGVKVVLAAMVSGDNWGQAYRQQFDSIFPDLAAKYGVTMVPFFMEGVWGDPSLLIGDGLHPNAAGVRKVVEKIAPYVEKTLASTDAGRETRAR